MKKSLVCMLACAALTLTAPADSQAMTDAQHRQFLKTSQDYRAADAQLNSVWRALKSRLAPAEFRQLLQEQRQWISTRREAEAKELIGQSIPEVDAYTATITSRVNELTERLGKLDSKVAKPEASPAPAVTPAEKPATPAKAEQAKPETKPAAEPAAKPETTSAPKSESKASSETIVKPAEPAKRPAPAAGTPDKPARVEIGLPFLGESKPTAPAAKPESKPAVKPATKPETKPAPKPETKPAAKPEPKPEAKAPAAKMASAPAADPCSSLQITSTRHFGNNVAAPFVEMVLRNDLVRNVKAVRVNGHEIKRAVRPVAEKPIWRVSSPRTVALDVFAHTILKTIDVEYADGPVCTIDKSKEEKDFTNPYVF